MAQITGGMKTRPRRGAVATLLLASLIVSGCHSLTEREQGVYDQYLVDTSAPRVEDLHSPKAATWLSVLWPGAGFFYLGRPGKGVVYSTIGLVLWPFMIPAVAANKTAKNLNKRHAVEVYEEYLRTHPRYYPAAGSVNVNQNQNVNQNTNVNVSAPPVVNVTAPVTVITPGSAPVERGAASTPSSERPASRPAPADEVLAPAAAFCPGCGRKADVGDSFCRGCGRDLRK